MVFWPEDKNSKNRSYTWLEKGYLPSLFLNLIVLKGMYVTFHWKEKIRKKIHFLETSITFGLDHTSLVKRMSVW